MILLIISLILIVHSIYSTGVLFGYNLTSQQTGYHAIYYVDRCGYFTLNDRSQATQTLSNNTADNISRAIQSGMVHGHSFNRFVMKYRRVGYTTCIGKEEYSIYICA